MKPRRDLLVSQLEGVDEDFVDSHLACLGDDYYAEFSLAEVVAHVRELSRLNAARPLAVLVAAAAPEATPVAPGEPPPLLGRHAVVAPAPTAADALWCTILAADRAGIFSLITGVLGACGFAIDTGAAYTYAGAPGWVAGDTRAASRGGFRQVPAGRAPAGRFRRRGRSRPLRPFPPRRMIVDRFLGRRVSAEARALSVEAWCQQLEQRLLEVASELERGAPEAARRRVSELVAETIRRHWPVSPTLYPVQIEIADRAAAAGGGDVTRMRIVSQDTPLFLYSFSAALALRDVSIQRIRIDTAAGRVEDVVDVVDRAGAPITNPRLLDQIKLSVLLTKQFAYFVGVAPDPYAAMMRFEQLTEQILGLPEEGRLLDLLAAPRIMRELALLLGTSDYLWEDFIRQQFETLLPMLEQERQHSFSDAATVAQRLRQAVVAAPTAAAKVTALNAFKDREAFLIDLEHVLNRDPSVARLAARLTSLAECVVAAALELAAEALRPQFGIPRTLGGIDSRLALVGLGKMGGRALGYASDIELMFVYGDQGTTTGPQQVGNGEYYERLAQETVSRISAKRAGIFEIDLRLRPYGAAGPRAVSLESFARYYGPGGEALAYERLALIRLRHVAGDRALGARLERLRDEFVYRSGAIALDEVHRMRRRQVAEYDAGSRLNAKFSPGTLVDVEYAVQMLQVRYGESHAALRTSGVHQALEELAQAGILAQLEAEQVHHAYDFYRRLINALRILRGSARDLYLPEAGAVEYGYLARRMGYRGDSALTPAQRLHLELETRRAAVRRFIDTHLGHGFLGSASITGVADLVLSRTDDAAGGAAAVLRRLGFVDPQRGVANFLRLTRHAPDRTEFARLAVLAGDELARQSDPDRALNNWERYVAARGEPGRHFRTLLRQPTRLELLIRIFATSQFLADALVRSPELFDWVTEPGRLHRRRRLQDVVEELGERQSWLLRLRMLRRREILRIAVRDYCLQAPVTDVMRELSVVAEAFLHAAVRDLAAEQPLLRERTCILAFGKLGAEELNYSSDIDLVALYDDRGLAPDRSAPLAHGVTALARSLGTTLAAHQGEMAAYRVDWRLRPYGSSGELAHSFSSLAAYYAGPANDWEVQALLRMRPVAGNCALGHALLQRARSAFARLGSDPARRGARAFATIERLRALALAGQAQRRLSQGRDIKSGAGGIRDLEFLVQGLQLQHLMQHPELVCGNTVEAIARLQRAGVLSAGSAAQLREDYLLLRRLEHFLQVFEDRQVHVLPSSEGALRALARRMLGTDATVPAFNELVATVTTRVRATYESCLTQALAPAGERPTAAPAAALSGREKTPTR